jgi:hypothetical protein
MAIMLRLTPDIAIRPESEEIAIDFVTALGLFLGLAGIGGMLVFVVWQPKHPIIRRVLGAIGLLALAASLVVLLWFAPIRWRSPLVLRSPFVTAQMQARSDVSVPVPEGFHDDLLAFAKQPGYRKRTVIIFWVNEVRAGKIAQQYYDVLRAVRNWSVAMAGVLPIAETEKMTWGVNVLTMYKDQRDLGNTRRFLARTAFGMNYTPNV